MLRLIAAWLLRRALVELDGVPSPPPAAERSPMLPLQFTCPTCRHVVRVMSAVATKGLGWGKRSTYIAQNANQGRGLAVIQGAGGDDYAAIAANANVVCLGVQEEASVSAGDPISVIDLGEAAAVAGAAVNAGQFVKCTAAGQFIPITTAGDNIVGQAKSSAALQGDEFILLVMPGVN